MGEETAVARSWGGLGLRRRLLGLRPGDLASLVGCHPMHIGLAESSHRRGPLYIMVLRERMHQVLARLEQAPLVPVVLLPPASAAPNTGTSDALAA